MNKIALFVEGYGEALFILELIREMFSGKNVEVESYCLQGARRSGLYELPIEKFTLGTGEDLYIQVVVSGSDQKVVTDAKDNVESLISAGFSKLFIVRDVYPNFSREQVEDVRGAVQSVIDDFEIDSFLILEVMELEAWFLSNCDDFSSIHADLSRDAIENHFGFYPPEYGVTQIDDVADKFKQLLASVGIDYDKSQSMVKSLVANFNMQQFYRVRCHNVEDQRVLIEELGGI